MWYIRLKLKTSQSLANFNNRTCVLIALVSCNIEIVVVVD